MGRVTDPADPTGSKVYDNFTLQVDSLITDLHWYGTYDRDFVTPRSAIDFRIEFFGSTGTAPDIAGGALYSNVFDAGTVGVNDGTQVSEIATGAQIVDGDGVNRAQFRYDLDPLVPSFAATAGTEYWLAITALQAFDHPTLPDPNWAWQIGALGDGVAYQFMADPADPFDGLIATDMAFTLTGPMAGVIPEPGSVAIWFATLVGVCGFVAVKKKKRG